MVMSRTLIVSTILSVAIAAPALAHPGHDANAGLTAGFAHPFGGLDHLLAMAAVGFWAMQQHRDGQGRLALVMVPAAFVLAMALGFLLGLLGLALPGVETGIALSVLVLGLLVAFAFRPPLAVAIMLTAGFALFHGHAHGTELPQAELALDYAAGMVLATAVLHGLGLLAARLAQIAALTALPRFAGAATALAGCVILLG